MSPSIGERDVAFAQYLRTLFKECPVKDADPNGFTRSEVLSFRIAALNAAGNHDMSMAMLYLASAQVPMDLIRVTRKMIYPDT